MKHETPKDNTFHFALFLLLIAKLVREENSLIKGVKMMPYRT